MNIIALLSFLSFGIHTAMAVYAVVANSRSTINRIFVHIAICFAIWSFCNTFFFISPTKEAAMIWVRYAAVGWTLVPGFFLHFLLLRSKNKHIESPIVILILYTPGIIFLIKSFLDPQSFVSDIYLTSYGWWLEKHNSYWMWGFSFHYTVYTFFGFYHMAKWGWYSKSHREKIEAQLIVTIGIIVTISVTITNRMAPELGIEIPSVAHIIVTLWVFTILYTMVKYNFMSLTPTAMSERIIESMGEGLLLVNSNGSIGTVNIEAASILEVSTEYIKRQDISDIFGCGFRNELTSMMEWETIRNKELYYKRNEKILNVNVMTIETIQSKRLGYILTMRDITLQKKTEEKLKFMASHDPLTKLPNRIILEDRVEQEMARTNRNEMPFSVFQIDIDRFKEINDTFGHHIGDYVLCQVADRIKRSIRECDTVSRIGGDEFVVVLSSINEPTDAEIVAKRILKLFKKPIQCNGHTIAVSISIGISIYPEHSSSRDGMLRKADKALYEAKKSRGTYHVFSRN